MSCIIYMDNHSTTRCDPRVVDAMLPFLSEEYGNSGSAHGFGDAARQAVEQARDTIASCIGADASELVFTSGATESNNLALRGIAGRPARRGQPDTKQFISVRTEHHAVLEPLQQLAKSGCEVTLLDVEPYTSPQAGLLDPQKVADALRDNTALVSVMLANNEMGVIQPLAEIAQLCHDRGVLVHCDATQGVGKVPVNVDDLGVDLMSFTAHKMYGPKGIGALYVRRRDRRVRLQPQITGGGQQEGRRSGTLNVPGIVGFAKALELSVAEMPQESTRLRELRNQLWTGLTEQLGDLQLCGPALEETDKAGDSRRLPGNLNFALGDIDGEALLLAMGNLAISTGATCASADPGPSHVLLALGMGKDLARSSLRFGLGRFNTAEEVEIASQTVAEKVNELRQFTAG